MSDLLLGHLTSAFGYMARRTSENTSTSRYDASPRSRAARTAEELVPVAGYGALGPGLCGLPRTPRIDSSAYRECVGVRLVSNRFMRACCIRKIPAKERSADPAHPMSKI
jgi:hypothetical protein